MIWVAKYDGATEGEAHGTQRRGRQRSTRGCIGRRPDRGLVRRIRERGVEDQAAHEELDAMSTDRFFSFTTQSLARLLNAKEYDGAEARAREIAERNPAELPVQASLAQLLMRRGKVAAAQKMMIAAVSHIRRLTMVTSPDGQVSGLLRTEDAAFADLRVAVSMANVGLDVAPAVTHALDVAPEYFPEQIVRKLLVALGNQLRHNKKGVLPEWARALLQRGEVCLRSCPL